MPIPNKLPVNILLKLVLSIVQKYCKEPSMIRGNIKKQHKINSNAGFIDLILKRNLDKFKIARPIK